MCEIQGKSEHRFSPTLVGGNSRIWVDTSIQALEKREGDEKCQIGLQSRHFEERFIWELASNTKILDCIEALIGWC